VTGVAALTGGIIAAGDGSRLRHAGWTMPKPLVPVAGVPLIEAVIRNFGAARVAPLRIIVNDRDRACVEWVRSRFPTIDIEFIVKTTASSLESFLEVTAGGAPGRMLVSTVDAWCREADFVRFVEAAAGRPTDATVLGVTSLVADEKPVWVRLDEVGHVTALGGDSGDLVTAGLYLVPQWVRALDAPSGLARLREFLAWLATTGAPLYGEVIPTVVDVDRADDVALAEALTLGARPS
jgi:NDP-sugar pyrophosphorylase family protein